MRCRDRCSSLKKNYGLEPEEYRKLLDATGGFCPICGKRIKKWNVDHDHKTGEITGVVCTRCNIGLLSYSDHDPSIARRLAEFLENPPVRLLGRVVRTPESFVPPSPGIESIWDKRTRR